MSVPLIPTRLNIRESADVLGIKPKTLYRWRREGRLSSYKIGQRITFELNELHRLIRESEQPRRSEEAA